METEVYVAYYIGKGFRTGKSSCLNFSDKLSEARIYQKRNYLSSSCGKHLVESGDIRIVPLKMSISPEDLTMLMLGGTIDVRE